MEKRTLNQNGKNTLNPQSENFKLYVLCAPGHAFEGDDTKLESELQGYIQSYLDRCIFSGSQLEDLKELISLEAKRLYEVYKRSADITLSKYENNMDYLISINEYDVAILMQTKPTPSYFVEFVNLNKMLNNY